jgi:hypothetical protein
MHRHWWRRACSAFVAVWFALVVVEPVALHSCPMHGGQHDSSAAPATAGHEHHADASEHASTPDSANQYCTCPGDCSGASRLGLPARPAARWTPDILAAREPVALAWAYSPVTADFTLPFANGPPERA